MAEANKAAADASQVALSALFEPLLDGVTESVVIRDAHGHVLLWNRASEALYGFTRDAMLGESLHERLKTRHPTTLANIENLLLQHGRWEGELTRTTASGEERTLEVRWTLQPGPPAVIIEYARAITRLSDLEVEARLQGHRYRNLFQAMAAAFWELDFTDVRRMMGELAQSGVKDFAAWFAAHPEFIDAAIAATRIIDVNDKTVSLFGIGSREAIIGGNISAFWPPESRGVYAASLLAAAQRLPSLTQETRLSTLDGRRFDVLFTVCWPPGHHGRGSVLVGIIDFSERAAALREAQASELRYRHLFQAMSTALLQLDTTRQRERIAEMKAQGIADIETYLDRHPEFITTFLDSAVITEVNDAAVRTLGAKDRSELIGLAVTRFWPVSTHPVVRRMIVASYDQPVTFEEETQHYRLDGREINTLFTVNASPELRARNMALVGMVDITERVAAQKAVRQLQAEFAHASRLSVLGELTASIAHEVNQPLAAIAANGAAGTRWLSRPEPDLDEVRSIHANMVSDARRAANIIARIRAMAANKASEMQRLSLNQIVEEALRFLHHELRAHDVEPRLELADSPPDVTADRVQLQQVVVNLALNALQEMKRAGSPQPRLWLRTVVEDSGALRFELQDSGPGIAQEHRERSSRASSPPRRTGWGWGSPSAATSSRHTGAASGRRTSPWAVRASASPCRPIPRSSLAARPYKRRSAGISP